MKLQKLVNEALFVWKVSIFSRPGLASLSTFAKNKTKSFFVNSYTASSHREVPPASWPVKLTKGKLSKNAPEGPTPTRPITVSVSPQVSGHLHTVWREEIGGCSLAEAWPICLLAPIPAAQVFPGTSPPRQSHPCPCTTVACLVFEGKTGHVTQ